MTEVLAAVLAVVVLAGIAREFHRTRSDHRRELTLLRIRHDDDLAALRAEVLEATPSPALAHRVSLVLKGDRAVTGLLVDEAPDAYLLRSAAVLEPGTDPVSLDGDVLVEKAKVDFVQILASKEG